ncbi:MAG: hypothetical protein P4L84_33045 [Isosphaeraceae bacterium]|nr:hypothetical protein [Isosphaeraceae bacterium]
MRNSGRYYYQTKRQGLAVQTEYIGRGELAEMVAELDVYIQRRRAAEAAAEKAVQDKLRAAESASAARFKLVDTILGWVLIRAGLHRHDRGPWRRKRMPVPAEARGVTPLPQKTVLSREEIDGCQDVLERAWHGDYTALPALKKLFDAFPEQWIGIAHGNLADVAEQSAIKAYAGPNNLAILEGVRRQLAAMRIDLLGPSPTAVERLLVDRVVLCWLDVHTLEVQHLARSDDLSPAVSALWDRRRTQANNRYLASLKSLQAVRKLGLPTTAVQMNVMVASTGNDQAATVRDLRADDQFVVDDRQP